MNICWCGVQDGYPHRDYCPFPYFGNDPVKVKEWMNKREKIILIRMEEEETNGKDNKSIE